MLSKYSWGGSWPSINQDLCRPRLTSWRVCTASPLACAGEGAWGSDKNSRDDGSNVVCHVTLKIMRQIEAMQGMIALSIERGWIHIYSKTELSSPQKYFPSHHYLVFLVCRVFRALNLHLPKSLFEKKNLRRRGISILFPPSSSASQS